MTDDEILKVVQGHKDGKEIQFKHGSDEWKKTSNPRWDFVYYDYRVKPEPHYVPYDSIDEVERDKWVRRKGTSVIRRIDALKHEAEMTPLVSVCSVWRSLIEMLTNWEYEDGTPFGKLADK